MCPTPSPQRRPAARGGDDDLLDIKQAAEFLRVSETSLRRWTNAGRLACLRVGRKRERRFRRADLLAFMEAQPATTTSAPRQSMPPAVEHTVIDGTAVALGSHLCGLYATDLGVVRLAVEFLAGGLRPGSACVLVALPNVRDLVLQSLDGSRAALENDIDRGRLVLSKYHQSAREQWDYFDSELGKAVADGAQSLRVVGDMWPFAVAVGAEELVEYEAGYEQYIARRFPVVTLCAYDVRQFSGVAVLNALKGHRDTFRYSAQYSLA
jgi:excisionase family DNA binding protein